MWKKLQTCKKKLSSQGGRETLIKVVALPIPTYAELLQTTYELVYKD